MIKKMETWLHGLEIKMNLQLTFAMYILHSMFFYILLLVLISGTNKTYYYKVVTYKKKFREFDQKKNKKKQSNEAYVTQSIKQSHRI